MIEELIEEELAVTIVEQGRVLPATFTVTIDQEPFAQLLRERRVPPTLTRLDLNFRIMGVSYVITVKSENDPEDWLPELFRDTLH